MHTQCPTTRADAGEQGRSRHSMVTHTHIHTMGRNIHKYNATCQQCGGRHVSEEKTGKVKGRSSEREGGLKSGLGVRREREREGSRWGLGEKGMGEYYKVFKKT